MQKQSAATMEFVGLRGNIAGKFYSQVSAEIVTFVKNLL
jgi:hypothetical protein